jgi:hypothetical protein
MSDPRLKYRNFAGPSLATKAPAATVVARLPSAHDQHPRHGEGGQDGRGGARTPRPPAAAEQEPERRRDHEEEADGARERGRGQQGPEQSASERTGALVEDEAQSDGDGGQEDRREGRVREEEARRGHGWRVEGKEKSRDPGGPLTRDSMCEPRAQGHGEDAQQDVRADHRARILPHQGVHGSDEQREAGRPSRLGGGRGTGGEAPLVEEHAPQRLVFGGVRRHETAGMNGRGGRQQSHAQAESEARRRQHRPHPGRGRHQA